MFSRGLLGGGIWRALLRVSLKAWLYSKLMDHTSTKGQSLPCLAIIPFLLV